LSVNFTHLHALGLPFLGVVEILAAFHGGAVTVAFAFLAAFAAWQ